MARCSLHRRLEVVSGDVSDYKTLAPYHYREESPAAVKAVFALRAKRASSWMGSKTVGVAVYCAPHPRVELRTVATNGLFADLDLQTQLALINANIRRLARLIIEPRFRGVGLATRLVRETMPILEIPIIEALGVMPHVNPFLERAGMQKFAPRTPVAHVQLVEAFSAVGIESDRLIDPAAVQAQIDALDPPAIGFLETYIAQFLKSHGTRRTMPAGLERTRYLCMRLARRPAYYIWFHPHLEVTMP